MIARNYNKYDPDKLSADLSGTDWSRIFEATDVNVAWDTFVTTFEDILNQHAPWQTMSVPTDSPEWETHEFISECKARDHYNIYAKRTRNPEHKREAKQIRNKVNQIAKNMKRVSFAEKNQASG